MWACNERAAAFYCCFTAALLLLYLCFTAALPRNMHRYDLGAKPPDAPFWDLIAFCAGTGGRYCMRAYATSV